MGVRIVILFRRAGSSLCRLPFGDFSLCLVFSYQSYLLQALCVIFCSSEQSLQKVALVSAESFKRC